MAREKKDLPRRRSDVVSADELGAWLDVTGRRVQQLARAGWVPRARRGKYPLADGILGYLGYLQHLAEAPIDMEEAEARRRKLAAEAKLRELELSERQGNLIPIDDLEPLLIEPLETVNARLKSLPTACAGPLAKAAGCTVAEAKAVLVPVAEQMRKELRTTLERQFGGDDEPEPTRAA